MFPPCCTRYVELWDHDSLQSVTHKMCRCVTLPLTAVHFFSPKPALHVQAGRFKPRLPFLTLRDTTHEGITSAAPWQVLRYDAKGSCIFASPLTESREWNVRTAQKLTDLPVFPVALGYVPAKLVSPAGRNRTVGEYVRCHCRRSRRGMSGKMM